MSNSINDVSGRSQSKARRKSKLSGGKSGVARATRVPRKKSEPVISASSSSASVVAAPVKAEFTSASTKRQSSSLQPITVAEGRAMAKQKRKRMIRGKTGSSQTNTQGSLKTRKKPDEMIELRSTATSKSAALKGKKVSPAINKSQVKSESSKGRNMSKARRKALVKGKAGQSSFSGQSSSVAKMANPGASVRDVARVVRAERCSKGKTVCSAVTKSSRRQKRKNGNDAPEKVSLSETLSGSVVSGVHVGQGQLTGAEKGACKNVSGTEYLGMEEFVTHCSTVPEASPSKVSFTQTSKGRTVSGTEFGQDKSVTGDRAGLCSSVTGTEYLPADQGDLFCGADQALTKPGTGSMIPRLMKPSCKPKSKAVPAKVAISTTMAGNMTTGTQVGRGLSVTGDERGYCQAITGIGYQGKEEVSAVCETNSPVSPPAKVLVSGTVGGQIVTGDRSGSVSGMTGGEIGSCQPVSGTAYVGTEFASNSCSVEAQATIAQRSKQTAVQSSQPMTGVRPGMMGLTGAQKGACEVVSGTHYQSASEMSQLCEGSGAATLGESDYPVIIGQATAATLAGSVTAPSVSPPSAITGDGWDKGNKVTGTDGAWAAKRNPSIRGVQGQSPMNASNFRPHSMPDVPQSPITGSSGNTAEGSKVTLSGGARA